MAEESKSNASLNKNMAQRFVWTYLDDRNYYKDFHKFLLTTKGKEALGVASIFARKRTQKRVNHTKRGNTSFGTLTDLEKEMLRYQKSQFYNREELRRHRAFPSRIREEISNTETKAILYNRFRDAAINFRPGLLEQTASTASEYASGELNGIGRPQHVTTTGHPLLNDLKDFDPTAIERYNRHKKYYSSDFLEERIQMELLKQSKIHPSKTQPPEIWVKNPYFSYNK